VQRGEHRYRQIDPCFEHKVGPRYTNQTSKPMYLKFEGVWVGVVERKRVVERKKEREREREREPTT